DRRARHQPVAERRPLRRGMAVGAALPRVVRGHDLGRNVRDPAQHRRRARPRPPALEGLSGAMTGSTQGRSEDPTGVMTGAGDYSRHSLAQHSAGGLGLPLLERAVADAANSWSGADEPIVIADLGAAGGRNELAPMAAAVAGLRANDLDGPVVVVHTDIATNDFTTLFETVEQDPG